jgi:hypothetical protein
MRERYPGKGTATRKGMRSSTQSHSSTVTGMRKALIVLMLVALVGGAIALVVTSRPELNKTRDATVAAWQPLIEPLNVRYQALAALVTRLDTTLQAAGEENSELQELKGALLRWSVATEGTDATTMVEAADELEARVGKLRAVLGASARLTQAQQVNQATAAFDQAAAPAELVTAYNESVRKYQRTRESTAKRLVAQLFGYGAIPTFEPSLAP